MDVGEPRGARTRVVGVQKTQSATHRELCRPAPKTPPRNRDVLELVCSGSAVFIETGLMRDVH